MEDKELKFIVIQISSWVGISIDAEHYYASYSVLKKEDDLDIDINDVDEWGSSTWDKLEKLQRPITAKEAKYLNKKDTWGHWGEGDLTERFNTIDEIVSIAIEKRKELGHTCPMVFLNEGEHLRPKKIIE